MWKVILFAFAGVLISNHFWQKALQHLSERGRRRESKVEYWLEWRAGRENFTERGWHYRNLAVTTFAGTMGALLLQSCFR